MLAKFEAVQINQAFPLTFKKNQRSPNTAIKIDTVKPSHIWFYQNIFSFLSENKLLLRVKNLNGNPILDYLQKLQKHLWAYSTIREAEF